MLKKDTCSFRFITTLPHSIFCLCQRKVVSANVIGSKMEEKQSIHRLKEKTPAFFFFDRMAEAERP